MSLKGIRDAIQTGLQTISGLRVHDTIPEGIMEVPCAWVAVASGEYPQTFQRASMNHLLEITLLLQRMGDGKERQESLDDYIDPSGASSVPAAIDTVDLGANGSSLLLRGYRDYGNYDFGEQNYLGVKFDIEVLVD